jgi:4-amino-4-deoxy-L-arabinose transferase-like glycosyltransferase
MVGDALDGQLLKGLLCPCPTDDGPLSQLPNLLFYPAVVLGPLWIFAPPLVGLVGLLYAGWHWREPAARFSLWLVLLTCGLLSAYVFQAARLAAAPAVLLALYAAVMAGRWLDQMASAGTRPSRPER